MKSKVLLAALAGASLLASGSAQAAREPSQHVRCDGNPNNVSGAETAARIIGAVTLLGLFAPPPEQSNPAARLDGDAGIAACEDVLQRETDNVRRAQLILASSVHHLEKRDYDGAVTSARRALTDRPVLAESQPFRLSLALSVYEIEATALLAQGRKREAIDKALEMADAAPYDLLNQIRAGRFVELTDALTPRDRAYFDRFVRLFPAGVLARADVREMTGDFAGAADDWALWMQVIGKFLKDEPQTNALARTALIRAIAGDMDRAAPLAAQARTAFTAHPSDANAPRIGELLDLYEIVAQARAGHMHEARLLFGARSTWSAPSPALVSAAARLLQQGAGEGEMIGSLRGDPDRFRNERAELQRRRVLGLPAETPAGAAAPADAQDGAAATAAVTAASVTTAEPAAAKPLANLFAAIRPWSGPNAYAAFSANVWRTEHSRYVADREDERMHARFVNVSRNGYGIPAGYALLLSTALVAQAQGAPTFMMLPAQRSLQAHYVRFGDTEGSNVVPAVTLDTRQVIADLQGIIPPPAPEGGRR